MVQTVRSSISFDAALWLSATSQNAWSHVLRTQTKLAVVVPPSCECADEERGDGRALCGGASRAGREPEGAANEHGGRLAAAVRQRLQAEARRAARPLAEGDAVRAPPPPPPKKPGRASSVPRLPTHLFIDRTIRSAAHLES
eukprot:2456790-Pleurochrysis_carterae.AAC.2